jgi:type II secretory pathway pseudopilin PulG
VELTVAMAILAVVFAAVMPVFAAIRNHADAAGADSEMVQNARVLNEQLYRYLAQAKRITAVSGSTDVGGYIELQAGDGATRRFQRASSGYVEFGPLGSLSELAGPVTYLKFTCYDGNDPLVQTVVAEDVRLVTWEARLDSAGTLTGDKIVRGACYLRVGTSTGTTETNTTYDFATGQPGVNCFTYAGEGSPQVPTTVTTPSSALTSAQYTAIKVLDGSFYVYTVSTNSNYARTRFAFTVQENKSTITQITATWTGKGVNGYLLRTDGASLYVWNYSTSAYELLQVSANTEGLVTLTGTRSSTPSRYFGGSGGKTLVLLVVSNDKKNSGSANKLYTDYVRLGVRASKSGGILP